MILASFGSLPDMVLLMAVALVVFGPKRLPEVGKQLGTFMREIRKTMGQFTDAFEGARSEVTTAVRPDDLWNRSTARFNEQNHLALDQPTQNTDSELMKPYTPPTRPEIKPLVETANEHFVPSMTEAPVLKIETVHSHSEENN